MNALLSQVGSLAALASVVLLSSCALPNAQFTGNAGSKTGSGGPLTPGVRYEVRKALAAGVPFRPTDMKRYYFVIEAPRPPLMAAATTPGRQMTVRTTAYCHDEDDHIVYGARNALGTPSNSAASAALRQTGPAIRSGHVSGSAVSQKSLMWWTTTAAPSSAPAPLIFTSPPALRWMPGACAM